MFSVQNLQPKKKKKRKEDPKLYQMIDFVFYLVWKKPFFPPREPSVRKSDWQFAAPSPQAGLPKCDLYSLKLHRDSVKKRSPFVIFWQLFHRDTGFWYLKLHWFGKEWIFLFEMCHGAQSPISHGLFSGSGGLWGWLSSEQNTEQEKEPSWRVLKEEIGEVSK